MQAGRRRCSRSLLAAFTARTVEGLSLILSVGGAFVKGDRLPVSVACPGVSWHGVSCGHIRAWRWGVSRYRDRIPGQAQQLRLSRHHHTDPTLECTPARPYLPALAYRHTASRLTFNGAWRNVCCFTGAIIRYPTPCAQQARVSRRLQTSMRIGLGKAEARTP